jgi:hypothetical protein
MNERTEDAAQGLREQLALGRVNIVALEANVQSLETELARVVSVSRAQAQHTHPRQREQKPTKCRKCDDLRNAKIDSDVKRSESKAEVVALQVQLSAANVHIAGLRGELSHAHDCISLEQTKLQSLQGVNGAIYTPSGQCQSVAAGVVEVHREEIAAMENTLLCEQTKNMELNMMYNQVMQDFSNFQAQTCTFNIEQNANYYTHKRWV